MNTDLNEFLEVLVDVNGEQPLPNYAVREAKSVIESNSNYYYGVCTTRSGFDRVRLQHLITAAEMYHRHITNAQEALENLHKLINDTKATAWTKQESS